MADVHEILKKERKRIRDEKNGEKAKKPKTEPKPDGYAMALLVKTPEDLENFKKNAPQYQYRTDHGAWLSDGPMPEKAKLIDAGNLDVIRFMGQAKYRCVWNMRDVKYAFKTRNFGVLRVLHDFVSFSAARTGGMRRPHSVILEYILANRLNHTHEELEFLVDLGFRQSVGDIELALRHKRLDVLKFLLENTGELQFDPDLFANTSSAFGGSFLSRMDEHELMIFVHYTKGYISMECLEALARNALDKRLWNILAEIVNEIRIRNV